LSFFGDTLTLHIHLQNVKNSVCRCVVVFITSCMLSFNWVDTSAGGLLVHEGITSPVVSVSALTWFIRYIHYWHQRA
jgi:hypothetical protein